MSDRPMCTDKFANQAKNTICQSVYFCWPGLGTPVHIRVVAICQTSVKVSVLPNVGSSASAPAKNTVTSQGEHIWENSLSFSKPKIAIIVTTIPTHSVTTTQPTLVG